MTIGLVATPQESETTERKSSNKQGEILVQTACTTCHSMMVINNAGKSREGWQKTFKKMREQGMPQVPAAFETSMIEFLTENHGEGMTREREQGPLGRPKKH